MPESTPQRRFFTGTMAGWLAVIVGTIALFAWYAALRVPRANAVVLSNGQVSGSFRHERGGFVLTKWPISLEMVGVLSHGTGGACLLAGVTDPATGLPATCSAEAECIAKFPRVMQGWIPYCSPAGSCWARRATAFDKIALKLPATTPEFRSCNRSPEPLDPDTGTPWDLNVDYPSNAPMDASLSRRWRVLACLNKIDSANPDEDLGGCSGPKAWGKILTLP